MIEIQCEACGATVSVGVDMTALNITTLASIMPSGWGMTGIPGVTPTALLCSSCRKFVGGYTVASFVKVNTAWTVSGSAAAIALVSGTNESGTYPL